MQQNRLISNYCLIGLDNELIPQLSSQRKLLTNIELRFKKNIEQEKEDIQVEWLDIFGKQEIFLLCYFNEPNKLPITNIKFVDADVRDSQIQFNYAYKLCPIIGNDYISNESNNVLKSINVVNYDQTKNQQYFDLSPFLYGKMNENISYVLCYTRKTTYQPIINLQLSLYDPNDISDNVVQFLELNKFQMNMIKQKQKKEQIYMPTMLDLYPFNYKESNKLKHRTLINNSKVICKLCLPEGVFLQKEQIEPITYYQIFQNQRNGRLSYAYCLKFNEPLNEQEIEIFGNGYYLQKAMVFISDHFQTAQFFSLLEYIYSIRKEIKINDLISQIVDNINYTDTLLQNQILLNLNQKQWIFYQNIHPISSQESFNYIFKNINLENIILIYTALLTERKIQLCSRYIQKPGQLIEVMEALLYPMQNPLVKLCYINIDDIMYFHQPIGYIIGVKENIDLPCEYDTIKFSLDSNVVQYVAPPTQLPIKLLKKLRQIEKYCGKDILLQEDIIQIRDTFFKINLKILKKIEQFKITDSDWQKRFVMIKQQQYKEDQNKESFWKKFSETSLLSFFISEIYNNIKTYLNQCYDQKDKKRIFVDFRPQYTNLLQFNLNPILLNQNIDNNNILYLTPYRLINSKQNALRNQIHRIWFQIVNSTKLHEVFSQLQKILIKEFPFLQIKQTYQEHEFLQRNDLNLMQYQLTQECPKCKKQMTFLDILYKTQPSYLINTIKCSKKNGCGYIFIPSFKIYDQAKLIGQFNILNIHILQNTLTNVFNNTFLETQQFWNLIIYFRLYNLPLPFVNEDEEIIYCLNECTRREQGYQYNIQENILNLEKSKEIQTVKIILQDSTSRR